VILDHVIIPVSCVITGSMSCSIYKRSPYEGRHARSDLKVGWQMEHYQYLVAINSGFVVNKNIKIP